MTFKMGFTPQEDDTNETEYISPVEKPKQSVVNVYFEPKNITLSYYNDMFDLDLGDYVFVEGKMEGIRGKVTAVNHNFKIDLKKYKRVISVLDTTVKGELFLGGSHYIAFDKDVLPVKKIQGWFMAKNEDEEIIESYNDYTFPISGMSEICTIEEDRKMAQQYFMSNMVKYVCIDMGNVYAVIQADDGTYEVEFEYHAGVVSHLVGSCYCAHSGCRHKLSALLQFYDILTRVDSFYEEEMNSTGYFAAISKELLTEMTFNRKSKGKFTIDM